MPVSQLQDAPEITIHRNVVQANIRFLKQASPPPDQVEYVCQTIRETLGETR
jgi:hypothetical protein